MRRHDLGGEWTVRAADPAAVPAALGARVLPARVPGCVHLDLIAAGVIDDPCVAEHELAHRWIGEADFVYERVLDVPPRWLDAPRLELVFEGLDTFAAVALDGAVVGEAANVFHPHRFDAREALVAGARRLSVTFRASAVRARAEEARLGPLPFLNATAPFNFVRTTAMTFGWDFAPSLPGCGVFAPAYLEAGAVERLGRVRPLVTRATEAEAAIEVWAEARAGALVATLRRGERTVARARAEAPGPCRLAVRRPERWWPRGHGEQPLYDLDVELRDGEETVDAESMRVGLREVRLDTSEDARGSRFTLEVNGRPIFCRGANWSPPDVFLPRALDPAVERARLDLACEAGMNTLRIWGGGLYGSRTLYDACDELGVLVWQDFPFACACYPEEEPLRSRIEVEARDAVARLARHPSLSLWNGCNENLWGYCDWGWREATAGRTWGEGYYLGLLPSICAELDPTRPYWPASPYSGAWDPPGTPHPNLFERGNRHVWEEWTDAGHPVFGVQVPRFCSELGFPAPATHATLARALGPGEHPLDGAAMQHRQRSERAHRNLRRRIDAVFGGATDAAEEHHLAQVLQARAMTAAVEWFRSRAPECAGVLYWQLHDCWPAVSWSAIDADGRPKLLWWASRRFFADRLLTFQPSRADLGRLALFVVVDDERGFEGEVGITRRRFDGATLARRAVELRVPARGIAEVALDRALAVPGDPSREALVATMGDRRAVRLFADDRALADPAPALDVAVRRDGDTQRVTLRARALVRELCVHADRLRPDASVDRQLVTLFPGEEAALVIRGAPPLDEAALSRCEGPVFRCSNRRTP